MKKNNDDFTTGSIPVKLIKFMLPILGALILQAMYGAVDLFIIGHFGTDEGIAAVSTGTNIINMATFAVSGLCMGVTVLIGRFIGERRADRVGPVIGGAICFFLCMAVFFVILLEVFATKIMVIMQVPAESYELTMQYVRICSFGLLFIISYNVIASIFRGIGNSRLPFIFVCVSTITNIIGDLTLIAGFKLNVVGAASATVFAQALSFVISLIIISKQDLPFKLKRSDIRFNPEVKRFIFIGLPIAIQDICTNITFLAINSFVNGMGINSSAGYGVSRAITAFIMLIPLSLMQSMAAFVAQNVGAGKRTRAKKAMFTGMIVGAIIGSVVFVCILAFGDTIASFFTGNEAYIAQAFSYLKGFAIESIITCVSFSFLGYFNGNGLTKFVLIQGIIQSFAVRLPFAYIMSIQPNPTMFSIGLAVPASTVVGIVLCSIYFLKVQKRFKAAGIAGDIEESN